MLLIKSGTISVVGLSRKNLSHFQKNNPQRLKVAERQGATRIVNVEQKSLAHVQREADVLIECSGSQTALQAAWSDLANIKSVFIP